MAEKLQAAEEPSIEEILGSIRRIIAEDEPETDEEPLELTNKIEPDGAVMTAQTDEPRDFASDTGTQESETDLAFDETPAEPPAAPAQPEPAPIQNSPAEEMTTMSPEMPNQDETSNADETILSQTTANAAAAVMSKLARHTIVADENQPGVTLENIVREMLKPLLRDWLDQNLPSIVQKTVERELQRLSQRV